MREIFSKITIIHFTVPLTAKQTGLKALVKWALGKPLREFDDNVVRNRFNAMLKQHYHGKAPVFDLAGIESTRPDGGSGVFKREGKEFLALSPELTADGAHLNAIGSRYVAGKLLLFLTEAAE